MAIYGILIDSPKHRFVKAVDTVMAACSETLRPGAVLIDVLPMCKLGTSYAQGSTHRASSEEGTGMGTGRLLPANGKGMDKILTESARGSFQGFLRDGRTCASRLSCVSFRAELLICSRRWTGSLLFLLTWETSYRPMMTIMMKSL